MKVLQILMFVLIGCMIMSCSDDNGPSITVSLTGTDTTYTLGDSIKAVVTATDDIGVASFRASNETNLFISTTIPADGTVSEAINWSVAVNENSPLGDHDIEFVAIDTDGNEDSQKVSITIE